MPRPGIDLPPETQQALRVLARAPRRAGWRVLMHLALVLVATALARQAGVALPPVAGTALTLLVAFAVGFGPLHGILVQGHDATHGLTAHHRRWNAFWLWFCHALIGVSGRAYRAFHLDHHRHTHDEQDPEAWFYDPTQGRPAGWGYLRLLWATHPMINTWRTQHTRVAPRQIATDLIGAAALHLALAVVLGPGFWAQAFALPLFTGMAIAVVLRALTEHHGAPLGGTRWTQAHPFLQWLWTNVDHHLAPHVPAEHLPAVRAAIAPFIDGTPDDGLIPTAFRLLVDPVHVAAADVAFPFAPRDLGHALKVQWFRDILKVGPARRHLWTLYFHGEAYEELHPLGVWIDRLAPRWARKLRRQFDDENRHAVLFTQLLAAEEALPYPVEGLEDVGWTQLHHCVPDVCEAAGRDEPFTEALTMRYLGFLHALETRSITDLLALRDAAQLDDRPDVVDVVTTILADERVHATWTWRALCVLAGDEATAHAVYAPIRNAEREGSGHILNHLLPAFEAKGAAPERLGPAWLRWQLMKAAARLGLAVPLLPLFPYRPPREVKHVA